MVLLGGLFDLGNIGFDILDMITHAASKKEQVRKQEVLGTQIEDR